MPTQGFRIDKVTYTLRDTIDLSSMESRAAKTLALRVIGGAGFLVSALLLLVGVFWVSILFGSAVLFSVAPWLTPSLPLFLIFCSLLIACFIFLHQTEMVRHIVRLPKSDHDAQPPELILIDTPTKDQIDILSFFDVKSLTALESAFSLANKFGHTYVEPIHLFIGAIEDDCASIIFGRLGILFDQVKDPLGRRLSTREIGSLNGLSDTAKDVLFSAFRNAYIQSRDVVSPLEIFYEAFQHDDFLKDLLSGQKVSAEQFSNMVDWIRINEKIQEQYSRFQKAAMLKPTGAMNRAMTSIATPILDAFSEDLTTAAVHGQLAMTIGREQEIANVFRVIEGGRQSAVLVGPNGVGKGSILGGIAMLMVEENVPNVLKDKRLVRISLPHLISGVSAEVAQERLLLMLDEVAKSRNIILAISDLELLSTDLAPLLVDFLSRGNTFAIATTTPPDYTAQIERSILGRIFQKVIVDEPNVQTAIQILESKIGGIEYQKNVLFLYEAVEKAVTLSDRYMHELYLPKKAIEIAREVAEQVQMTAEKKGERIIITGNDIAKVIVSKTGIPVTSVVADEKMKLLHLEDELHARIIGQDEAVKAIASALRRARADVQSGKRPIATFLFLGPTGVGKTELAKTLAAVYFGGEQMMIRADMSEFQDARSLDKLIGTPGSNQGGIFSEAVRNRPFSVILLDELEKADPNILNVFLQILDDGRVTDAAGRIIDFTNTIIIATSNAGTSYIQDAVSRGDSIDSIKTHLLEEELRAIYRPEFLNRFDGIVVFSPLREEEILQITKLMIVQVAKRLETKGIGFIASAGAISELAQKGYDPKFGARPLRRVVQEEVDNAVANALLEGKVQRRDTILLDAGGIMTIQKGKEL